MSNIINPETLKGAFILGAKRLDAKKDYINELNVFPVPDGDTGTNMSMTVGCALNDIIDSEYLDIADLCKAISQGSLRGARGNSGVILSQLFRGFYKVIKNAEYVDTFILAEALSKATETAYRAVMKPKEGTILTVAKSISDAALDLATQTDDISKFYDGIVAAGKTMLKKTPEMLPVLKQAGVVDSGGAGLIEILEGASDYISGRDTDINIVTEKKSDKKRDNSNYIYELNFCIYFNKKPSSKITKDLEIYFEGIGTVKKLNIKEELISVHLLTNDPGRVISRAIKSGEIDDISVKNIKPSHVTKPEEKNDLPIEKKDIGIVSVSIGDGLSDIFKGLGVDYCISGGQTMNPSTEDILEAIGKVNANHVFVLPNNKNILLAAEQAAKMSKDKDVIVIPTTTIPQGICALLNFTVDADAKDNKEAMCEELKHIHSGEITYAVRDTIIENKSIKKGDFMGIGDSGILSVEKNIPKCAEKLVEKLYDDESSLISLYYGADVTQANAKKLANRLAKKFPDLEIELQYGGQPVYYYVISVE